MSLAARDVTRSLAVRPSSLIDCGGVHAAADVDAVVHLIDHRRAELQEEALWIGARVYAEKPKAFVKRMRKHWKAGREHATATASRRPKVLADATRT